MKNDLSTKIDEVKDQHAVEVVAERDAEFTERQLSEALFFLGRVKQTDTIAVAISKNLTAQTIRALEQFQAEGMYKRLGYQTFVDFLEKSEYSPMSKRQYYERRELMNAHGDEIYDLLTSVGISVRSQRLLGAGDLRIENDRLMVGDTEVDVGNSSIIKEAIQELCDERRTLQADKAKLESKLEDQQSQIERGQSELEELQRNFDAAMDGDPFDRVVANAIHAMLLLQEAAGSLDDKVKATRGPDILRQLWQQFQSLQTTFGTNIDLDNAAAAPSDDLVSRALTEDDDQ